MTSILEVIFGRYKMAVKEPYLPVRNYIHVHVEVGLQSVPLIVINPQRACAVRITVLGLSVCLCIC